MGLFDKPCGCGGARCAARGKGIQDQVTWEEAGAVKPLSLIHI